MSVFKFAVIIHPSNHSEINKQFTLMRGMPGSWSEKIVNRLPPLKTARIKGKTWGGEIEGSFIYLGLTSEQIIKLPEKYCLDKLLKCGKIAERYGAQLIGLAGQSSVIGNGGVDVARVLRPAVTTGKTYKVATILESAEKKILLQGKSKEETSCVIIGAETSVGNACVRILIRKGFRYLTLIAPEKRRIKNFVEKILYDYGLSVKVTSNTGKALLSADLVIRAGGMKEVDINNGFYKKGVIICNLYQPMEPLQAVIRCKDAVIIDGGVIQVPEQISFDSFAGNPPHIVAAEVAEAIILALENRKHSYSLGEDMRVEKVDEIMRLARKHGFTQTGFYSCGKLLTCEK